MREFLVNSVYFGIFLTLASFQIGRLVHKKTGFFLFSPLLVSIALCIVFLVVAKIPYETYAAGASLVSLLLTPATVCLAIPLYEQFEKLKENALAVLAGILCGVVCNLALIFALCVLFKIDHTEYVSMLAKSVTTAIALGITEELHGMIPIIVVMVTITGNLGNLLGIQVCRLFGISESIAKGVAMGSSSHGMGTSRALQEGQVEGAVSGLSVGITGLVTVALAPVFAHLL